ncbi:MAG TPA: hypothetical protein VFS24_01620 [Steroidobacteraceae bacterium]|nr:hypothetical protein [Steroidobacteraceae bacterium]
MAAKSSRSRPRFMEAAHNGLVPGVNAASVFSKLCDTFKDQDGVELRLAGPLRFGAKALYANGKIFAMLSSRSELVFKLPAAKVRELSNRGVGAPFDPRHGKPMREWVVVKTITWQRVRELGFEAFEFVRACNP